MRHTWIGQPLTVLALVVLVVNDHVLKQAFPGFVTGKLSDVAGLILLPPLLDLVLRRPKVSIAVTGIAFTLVKASATGAWLASEAWSLVFDPSVVLADPTDLLALPALWAAWWAYRHPVPVHKAVVFLLVPPAVLAVAATSMAAYDWPYTAYAVVSDGDEIVVHTEGGYGYGRDLIAYRTRDGVTWDKWIQHDLIEGAAKACLGARCYRVARGHLRVEESRAGVWTPVWSIPDKIRDHLFRFYPEGNPAYSSDMKEPVESLSVAVTERLVVVANGADGIALRDARGAWHRLGIGPGGFDPARAAPLTVSGRYDVFVLASLAALVATLLALFGGAHSPLVVVGGAMMVFGLWVALSSGESLIISGALPFGLMVCLPGTGLVAFGVSRARPPGRLVPVSLLAGLLAVAAVVAPYAAWQAGWLELYSDADTGAKIAFGAVALAAIGAGDWTRRPNVPVPHGGWS
ncbi:hypothetical protein [Herbidospora mongoliensis]|uniref:hypothetical protein n=1 Tax=Herbidospora mongoliensis TaxID=688067 RepID=UPI00082EF8F1|nr:hypothetical protein [Herbidospora mongoliensis]